MPYDNVPESMWGKMDDCVKQVMADGKDKPTAVAICYTSIVGGKSLTELGFELKADPIPEQPAPDAQPPAEPQPPAPQMSQDEMMAEMLVHAQAIQDMIEMMAPQAEAMAEGDQQPAPDMQMMKLGARNNAADLARIAKIRNLAKDIHKTTTEMDGGKSVEPEALISWGGSVKFLGETPEGVHVGGYLVRYGSQDSKDLTGQWFTKATDFGLEPGEARDVGAYFHHGQTLKARDGDITITRRVGKGTIKQDDAGVLIDAILYTRDEYERAITNQIKALGWSSGALSHMVDIEPSGEITRWIIGEASVTPTPAEPQNSVVPLKSFSALQSPFNFTNGAIHTNLEEVNMDETELKAALVEAGRLGAEAALKSLPPVNSAGGVQVTHDEADNKFLDIVEQSRAIKDFETSRGTKMDPRLKRIKAIQGANETVGSEGGFLLEPEIDTAMIQSLAEGGATPFTSDVQNMPTSKARGMKLGLDETSRVTTRWGGLLGYRLAEGATITKSKPAFREINWSLKKYACLVYGTDELLADAPQFRTLVNQGCTEELFFMLNDDVLNGVGSAGLLGILNSGAFVSVAKETSQGSATVIYENVVKMWARVPPRCKPNAKWYVNPEVTPQLQLMALAVGTGGIPANFVTYTPTGGCSIFGAPVVETEFNAALGTQGDIMVADLSWYYLWQHSGGVQAASSIYEEFLTDQEVFRFIIRATGEPANAAPLTLYKGSATYSPFVVLDAR